MDSEKLVWLELLVCVTVILLAGTNLARYGDILAEKTGLGKTWIGVVLLASVTSLAELVTGISAVTRFDVPDIAAGDALGSCMFNVLILAVLDVQNRGLPISSRAHQGQVLSAAFGVVLLGLVGISLAVGPRMPSIGWVGVSSLGFIAVYLLAMRLVFTYERRRIAAFVEEAAEEFQYGHISRTRALTLFAVNAVAIVGAASVLPHVAEQIARLTGAGETLVGTVLVALSTSLPEIAVSIAALRLGAVDMVYGSLFGSNLFNVAILGIDDLFYVRGPLLAHVSSGHLISVLGAASMTAVAVIGLTYRADKKGGPVAWDALALGGTYLLATWALYAAR